jgi:hypothetical protein
MDQLELETSHSCDTKGLAKLPINSSPISSLFRFRQRRWQSVRKFFRASAYELKSFIRSARHLICSGRSQHLGCSEVGDGASGITNEG